MVTEVEADRKGSALFKRNGNQIGAGSGEETNLG